MENFITESFFDLNEFPYSQVFAGCTYAWEALGKIDAFLEKAELGQIHCPIPEGVHLVNPELIRIGKNTVVEPGAYIQGPCIIGEDCEIRHGAYIRGSVIVGNGCILGHATEIKYSILLNEVCAGHFNYIGDSILGNRVNLGAGVKLANLRLDHEHIHILYHMQKISTELKKMGAVIGDGTQMGCNGVTNPGTVIGKEAFCYPSLTVSGYIPPQSRVKSTHKMVIQDYVDRSCF